MHWNEELEESFKKAIKEVGIRDSSKLRDLYSKAYFKGYFINYVKKIQRKNNV